VLNDILSYFIQLIQLNHSLLLVLYHIYALLYYCPEVFDLELNGEENLLSIDHLIWCTPCSGSPCSPIGPKFLWKSIFPIFVMHLHCFSQNSFQYLFCGFNFPIGLWVVWKILVVIDLVLFYKGLHQYLWVEGHLVILHVPSHPLSAIATPYIYYSILEECWPVVPLMKYFVGFPGPHMYHHGNLEIC
jgi:hypothetical protein